ncbi:MAG TPA: DUF2752 domain-containing protein [Thermoanaerobaculia bacterium]|nr:DUF2752 domain-containing protein [Thermoanaerobaculia bacterium]
MAGPAARRWLLTGLAGLAGLAVLHVWVPSGDPSGAICLSRRLLHIPCPGCGMTRAFAHLAKGEWGAALALHPLAPAVALEMVLGWIAWGVAAVSGRPLRSLRLPVRIEALLVVNAAALCALWLGRAATGTLPW